MGNERQSESISAEDLKRVIKKMIRKALNDNEHMVKLHRKICEEWYNVLGQKNPENLENLQGETKNHNKPISKPKNDEIPKSFVKKVQKENKSLHNPQKDNKRLEQSLKNDKTSQKNEINDKISKKIPKNDKKLEKMQKDDKSLDRVQKPSISEETLRKVLEAEQENALGRKQRAWEFYHQQKRLQKGWKMRKSMEFNSWLNQLDSVLHQKYLREHRHQVQSFYCQPTYYGNEIPEALFRSYCMQYALNNQ